MFKQHTESGTLGEEYILVQAVVGCGGVLSRSGGCDTVAWPRQEGFQKTVSVSLALC